MSARGIDSQVDTFNTLIQILAYSTLDGAAPDDATARAFSRPAAQSVPTDTSAGTPAAIVADSRRAAAALTLVDEMMIRMRKDGITPDTRTYDALFNVAIASCRVSTVVTGDDVERWLDEMATEGSLVTANTWNALSAMLPLLASRACVSASRVCSIMQKLMAQGAPPSVQNCNMLLTAIARACRHRQGSVADAGAVLRRMQDAGISFNCYTFNALFDVLAAAADAQPGEVRLGDVREMLLRMQDMQVSPDTVTLNNALSVLLALARARRRPRACAPDAEDLIRVFEDDFCVSANVISFTKLLEIVAADAGHGRAALADAERILDLMRRRRIEPSRISWNVVLGVVARSAMFETEALAQVRVVSTIHISTTYKHKTHKHKTYKLGDARDRGLGAGARGCHEECLLHRSICASHQESGGAWFQV